MKLREAAQNMVRVWHEYDDEGQQSTAVELLETALAAKGVCEHPEEATVRHFQNYMVGVPHPHFVTTCRACGAMGKHDQMNGPVEWGQPYRPADGPALADVSAEIDDTIAMVREKKALADGLRN